MGVGSTVIAVLERGNTVSPITIGSKESTEEIYIVYHPGASKFTTGTLKTLAENIAKDNYKVTLYVVNKNLELDLNKVKAIGFASPIYVGNIRNQLFRYIEEDNLCEKKCFIIVTGSNREGMEKDTSKVATLIEQRGGKVIGKTKFITTDKEKELQEKIDLFGRELLSKL